METNDMKKSCVKCKKMVKSTETVLVCGLWCGKAFHNTCVGLTRSESRVVTCSNKPINFHCENCRSRLGMEFVGEQETHEPNKLQNCVNNSLLKLVQKILKVTNELSSDNSVINKKLDTVISSNTRLEEYILQSPKCLEKRGDEIIENNVEYLESFSAKRTTEISEENNDTNADNPSVNSASMSQQTDDNSSSLYSASHIPTDNQEPFIAEECSSNKWEVPGHQNTLQDPPSTIKQEHIPSEDILVPSDFSIAEREYERDEEKAAIKIKEEECSSSEDILDCGTFSIEKIEDDVYGEPGGDNMFEERKYEVKPETGNNELERTIVIGLDYLRNKDDSSHLITKDLETARKRHRIQSTTKQEVSCGNKKTFKQKTTLKQHSRLHSGERAYSCSLCNKTFAHRSSLWYHLRLHSGERPFSCSVCNKTFTKKSNLGQHLRMHTGERPYSCNICNKTFTKKCNLKQHMRLHSGERPFSCSVCNKTFTLKRFLQRHMLSHTGERPYSCSLCSKRFTQKYNLQQHFRLHTVERPFSCSVCDKTFSYIGNMKRHSQIHTGKVL